MEKQVAVIGKGMIGISLAVLFTGNGYRTRVLAKNAEVGLEKYRTYYRDLISQGLVTEKQAAACERRLSFTEDYADLAECEVAFECVTEKLEVKYEVYGKLEASCPRLKAIASTTSAISPVDLAKGVKQPERVMVAHPYNPPHMVPCVELVKNDFTAQSAIDAVVEILEACGREVCRMNKPAPGFIANRLQHALYREAVYMVEQGICAPEDIDKCIRSSWGPRYTSIGLFDHFDYAGLDLIA
ncbi:MAG: 3-hydroxyacyl-CoA dehydrogenase family protein, partial [Oscillibacter sp.]|nr:3-hydroxyacyl-CoA dehydrogenase family protein [Oscillibacter sp.]